MGETFFLLTFWTVKWPVNVRVHFHLPDRDMQNVMNAAIILFVKYPPCRFKVAH